MDMPTLPCAGSKRNDSLNRCVDCARIVGTPKCGPPAKRCLACKRMRQKSRGKIYQQTRAEKERTDRQSQKRPDLFCSDCGELMDRPKRGPNPSRCKNCKRAHANQLRKTSRERSKDRIKRGEISITGPEAMVRKIAFDKGLIRYVSGSPCSNGHIAERYVVSNQCVECSGNKGTGGNETREQRDRRRQARRLAQQAGEPKFFTGERCINGHIAERYTKDNVCVQCSSDRNRERKIKRQIERGGVTYISGKPCKNGHMGERYSSTDECVECKRIKAAYDRQRNIDRERERDRAWKQANKDKERTRSANRRAHRRKSEGSLTPDDVAMMYASQKGCCFWCGITVDASFHRDHIQPIAKGGSNSASNIVIACETCNSRKQDKCPDQWAEQILGEVINGTAPFPWQQAASHDDVVKTLRDLCDASSVCFDEAWSLMI